MKPTLQEALNEFDTETPISFENSKIIIATREHAGTRQPRSLHTHNRETSDPRLGTLSTRLLNFLRII